VEGALRASPVLGCMIGSQRAMRQVGTNEADMVLLNAQSQSHTSVRLMIPLSTRKIYVMRRVQEGRGPVSYSEIPATLRQIHIS